MGRWHVRHQLGTSWCLLRGGCQWKQELWLHGEAWHRQLILWLDCQVFFSTAHACPWYASILMPWHEPGTGGSPQPCRRLRFPGVFLRAEGVIKMSCRRGGRWNEDDLVESSVSDLLRNVTCKPLLFVSFCQVALIYLYINMLKPIAGRISIWIEIIEIDWNFLEQSLRGGIQDLNIARIFVPWFSKLLGCQEIIETTKIDECRDRWIGILIWHFVHHTPVHLFGRGPWFV